MHDISVSIIIFGLKEADMLAKYIPPPSLPPATCISHFCSFLLVVTDVVTFSLMKFAFKDWSIVTELPILDKV